MFWNSKYSNTVKLPHILNPVSKYTCASDNIRYMQSTGNACTGSLHVKQVCYLCIELITVCTVSPLCSVNIPSHAGQQPRRVEQTLWAVWTRSPAQNHSFSRTKRCMQVLVILIASHVFAGGSDLSGMCRGGRQICPINYWGKKVIRQGVNSLTATILPTFSALCVYLGCIREV